MGSWGAGLYQDDTALDLKNTIALLVQLPASGDRLLEILLDNHGEAVGLDDPGGPTFWLVLADQFERRGIACPRAFTQALTAIETGADLRDLESRDAGPTDLRRRAKILTALATRFRSPRPARPRPKGARLPPVVVEVGDVYRFPTMRGEGFNAFYPTWERAGFKPDGWGALLIVAHGRAFDWFPWCAAASLTVSASRPPSLDDAIRSRFISTKQGATLIVPRRTHMKKMQMELLGRLNLDPAKAASVIDRRYTPQYAVLCGWTFIPQARAWQGSPDGGVPVGQLLAEA